ncbi:hypothetical protein, partial [Neisseria sicca]|uniref:hypothetical protein n=2 Tax=Neisseria sicca TaxID=490 RepID=UPI001C99108D
AWYLKCNVYLLIKKLHLVSWVGCVQLLGCSSNGIWFSDDLFLLFKQHDSFRANGGWCTAAVSVFFIIFKILGFRRPLVFWFCAACMGFGLAVLLRQNQVVFSNSCHINDVMLYNNNLFEI